MTVHFATRAAPASTAGGGDAGGSLDEPQAMSRRAPKRSRIGIAYPMSYHRTMTRYAWALALVCASCIRTPSEGVHSATPLDAAVAGALAANDVSRLETAETVYAWHLEVVGGRAKYHACAAADDCSFRVVECDASRGRNARGRSRCRSTDPLPHPGHHARRCHVRRARAGRSMNRFCAA
jgi:hypothetical protein